jgi:hypothetical protein
MLRPRCILGADEEETPLTRRRDVNAKTTYYIKLKSCSNTSCETKIFEVPSNSLSAYEFVNKVQGIARAWGRGNGSKCVLVSAETCPGGCVVSEHAIEVPQPQPPVLRATLTLEGSTQFWAVLEALQQFIDNGNDADDVSEELEAKLEAAEAFRDQLDAVLASLAN